jgi:hypothetical protein
VPGSSRSKTIAYIHGSLEKHKANQSRLSQSNEARLESLKLVRQLGPLALCRRVHKRAIRASSYFARN